jgi:hypothetical protein
MASVLKLQSVMPDAKVKVDMWLWPMIGFHPIILVFWARNGRGYGPRLTNNGKVVAEATLRGVTRCSMALNGGGSLEY